MTNTRESAPDFTLPGTGGTETRLSALAGGPVVLFFYPKDDTSGCTTEAKDFSALMPRFQAAGVRVFGISKDGLSSHEKFAAKHALSVTLLSDEGSEVCEAYGVWKEKSMYGRKFLGIERSTFLIDATGRIAAEWRKVKVPGHAEAVLAAAEAL